MALLSKPTYFWVSPTGFSIEATDPLGFQIDVRALVAERLDWLLPKACRDRRDGPLIKRATRPFFTRVPCCNVFPFILETHGLESFLLSPVLLPNSLVFENLSHKISTLLSCFESSPSPRIGQGWGLSSGFLVVLNGCRPPEGEAHDCRLSEREAYSDPHKNP